MIKKVLVTGGSGFVGKELINRILSTTKWKVINIDIDPSLIEGIEEFQHDLSLFPIDIPPVDVCFHLASGVGGILFNYKDHLVEYNHNINQNTYIMCKEHDPILIFISSLNVFENSESKPTPYAISKLRGEKFFSECDLNHAYCVRPSNLFGKSQLGEFEAYGESHVIPDLVQKINTADEEIEVWGDGTQIRNFLHVSDLCDFLMKIVEDLPQQTFFNVRSNITITIGELVSKVQLFCKSSLNVKFNKDYMKYEILHVEKILKSLENIGKVPSIEKGLTF